VLTPLPSLHAMQSSSPKKKPPRQIVTRHPGLTNFAFAFPRTPKPPLVHLALDPFCDHATRPPVSRALLYYRLRLRSEYSFIQQPPQCRRLPPVTMAEWVPNYIECYRLKQGDLEKWLKGRFPDYKDSIQVTVSHTKARESFSSHFASQASSLWLNIR
jgi:hypothetical protein